MFWRRCCLPSSLCTQPFPDISHTDKVVDLLEDRADVAIRAGPLKSSSLIARKLGAIGKIIVASPAYLKQHGTAIGARVAGASPHRLFLRKQRRGLAGQARTARPLSLPVTPGVQVGDGEAMRHMALSGVGLARLARFTVRADIEAGRLVPVLEDLNPGDIEEFYAVYIGQGGPLPARVRALLDFLADHVRL
jgi:DNA-binding transcriptional LysR family regulator